MSVTVILMITMVMSMEMIVIMKINLFAVMLSVIMENKLTANSFNNDHDHNEHRITIVFTTAQTDALMNAYNIFCK